MWTSWFFIVKKAENSKRKVDFEKGGQAVFLGGEKCGKNVDKWK